MAHHTVLLFALRLTHCITLCSSAYRTVLLLAHRTVLLLAHRTVTLFTLWLTALLHSLLFGSPHCITLLAHRTVLLSWLTALYCITLLAYRTVLYYTLGLPHCITLVLAVLRSHCPRGTP